MGNEIQEAKRRLPLPELMKKVGLGEHAKKSSRCPFHEDRGPSFSIWEKDGRWRWKCHAGCGGGDEIELLMQHEGLNKRDAITRYLDLAGVQAPARAEKPAPPFDWAACVSSFTDDDAQHLVDQRGFSVEFCTWLRNSELVGRVNGSIALPVNSDSGAVIAAHCRRLDGGWYYEPKGTATAALVIGDLHTAQVVHVFESQWDGFAVCDKLGMHEAKGTAIFIIRGAQNGSLVAGRFPKRAAVFAWPQNDADEKRDKQGRTPADKWLDEVIKHCASPVRIVRTPPRYKDANDWTRADGDGPALFDAIDAATARDPLRSIMDVSGTPDPRRTVLGNRFLCIGGAMLFVGPSGVGKSSASMQQDILWSLGREAFGIRPQRLLRILTIQAENDDDDLAEMRDGVIRGLGLSEAEIAIVRANVFYETARGKTGDEFLAYVEKRLAMGQFDLLRIDPLQAYPGGDIKEPAVIAGFLREGLDPILQRQSVACILNHHTPKTNHRDTSLWRGSDWMYAGAGGADITNWARAVMVIDPTYSPHVFKFIAAKRGARIGWVDENGEREVLRYFCHAEEGLYWRAATPEDIAEAEEAAATARAGAKGTTSAPQKTPADLKALIPKTGAIPKNALLSKAQENGIGYHKARGFLTDLLTDREVFEHRIKRPNTNAEVRISLHEEELFEPNPARP